MKADTQRIYDEWLVLRCQTGDREAVSLLVARWQSPLLRFATIVTGDRDLAREAVQEGWIAVMRNIGRLDDVARYRQWLFRIVHNKSIDALRGRSSVEPAVDVADPRSPIDEIDDSSTVEAILSRMNSAHRSVLALHYLYEMEVSDIADLLGIPAGTVKSRLFNAREAFRRVLEGGNTHGKPGSEDRARTQTSYRFSGCQY